MTCIGFRNVTEYRKCMKTGEMPSDHEVAGYFVGQTYVVDVIDVILQGF